MCARWLPSFPLRRCLSSGTNLLINVYLDAIMTTTPAALFTPKSRSQPQLQDSAPHLLEKYANVKLTRAAVSFTWNLGRLLWNANCFNLAFRSGSLMSYRGEIRESISSSNL
jgi:hypothetical protein